MLIDLAKKAAPVLVGVIVSRVLIKQANKIAAFSKLGQAQAPALAIGAVLLTHVLTKKVGKLAKYRTELMLGTSLNALDVLISTFAPASVKGMIGTGDFYSQAFGDYVQMNPVNGFGDYMYAGGGGPPISEMGEYVSIGAVEEELGAVEEELGMVEEELGSIPGGLSEGSLLRPVPSQAMLAPVPDRSFVRPVPPATQAFDNPSSLYRGIFAE